MTPLVVEAWHLLVALVAGVGAVLVPVLRVRASVAAEAVRRERIDARIASLERFRESHQDACHREHAQIRDAVKESASVLSRRLDEMAEKSSAERARMAERLSEVQTAIGNLDGRLSVLLSASGRGVPP